MTRATTTDISLTKSYIPKVSKIPGISPTIAKFYKSIKKRNIHEGHVVDQDYYKSNNIELKPMNMAILVISFHDSLHEFIILLLAQFGQNPQIPYNGQAVFTNEWDLASLEYLKNEDYIISSLEQWAHYIHCLDRVMRPLALKQTRRPRSDRGKARHSVSSSSSHHQGTSSHQHDDDDDDVETSRASTPSPTTYLNSLDPLNYQNYQMPSSSEQTDETLFERQTDLLNQTQQMHKEMRGGVESFEEVDISFLSVEVVKVCLMKDMGCKVKFLRVFEMIEHDGRVCIYGAFVSVDTNDILMNDEFPILDVGRKIISEDNGRI
ncbi:hypothetical protein Tco_1275049 [Tanacetum coccineum]